MIAFYKNLQKPAGFTIRELSLIKTKNNAVFILLFNAQEYEHDIYILCQVTANCETMTTTYRQLETTTQHKKEYNHNVEQI